MLFDKNQIKKLNEEKLELINRRRRQILVHSYLYYKMNTNIINDYTFDNWCRELMSLQAQYPNESKQGVFSKLFSKWTGFSGYDLFRNAPDVESWAQRKAQYLTSLQ